MGRLITRGAMPARVIQLGRRTKPSLKTETGTHQLATNLSR